MKTKLISFLFIIFCFSGSLYADEYVVVKGGTHLYPSLSSQRKFYTTPKNSYFVFKYIEGKKSRVYLQLEKHSHRSFYSRFPTLHNIELKFWVSTKSLAKVTLEKVEKHYLDGSLVKLAAGRVVAPKGVFVYNNSILKIDLKGIKTGTHYTASLLPVARRKGKHLKNKTGIQYGDNFFKQDDYYASEEDGFDVISNSYFYIKGKINNAKIYKPLRGGGGFGASIPIRKNYIKKGTLIYDRKHNIIGKTNRKMHWKNASKQNNYLCLDFFPSAKTKSMMELCVQNKDLQNATQLKNRLTPFLKIGKITTKGCDQIPIEKTLEKKSNALRYCYEKRLQHLPKLEAKIQYQWVIKKGKVGEIDKVSVQGADSALTGCIERVLSRTRFKNIKMCTINSPFIFTQKK